MTAQRWFGVRCHFNHPQLLAAKGSSVYEERVVLVRAPDEDRAIAKAEAEALEYATDGTAYLELAECFELFAAELEDGVEVFSLMRESSLKPDRYLNKHFVSGKERSRE